MSTALDPADWPPVPSPLSSLDPPLVSLCVAKTSTSWPLLRECRRIGVDMLAAHQARQGSRVEDGLAFQRCPVDGSR
ncbi:flavin reductase family protein [Amycolatopsis sp. NPDC005232]|uniref:flavin reductase family protein n=1 Tax=Amycolatopsis sp. NPDC005232 TaxID=3157027 RepID=UPI0033AF6B96